MRLSTLVIIIVVMSVSLISACSTGGEFISRNMTSIELAEDNYDIVARDVMGSSRNAHLLGLSVSTGASINTFALARVAGTATLYNDAFRDLWKNYEEKYGSVEGKNVVLANVRYDTDILNLLIYTSATLRIHADVVQFRTR